METKRVQSLVIRLNNGNDLAVKQSIFRKTLYGLQDSFNKNVVQKIRKMEKM